MTYRIRVPAIAIALGKSQFCFSIPYSPIGLISQNTYLYQFAAQYFTLNPRFLVDIGIVGCLDVRIRGY
ncbi:hypothetical protein [Nostoc sp. CMAA1605]|uniref:hypothetical protein n=1 Tax=Nostoc sp. CMAA1605 TaxID=2055159 RepID=UPI001F233E0F|nr:hypothetical protein [Nostoc sp. CMAA1605]